MSAREIVKVIDLNARNQPGSLSPCDLTVKVFLASGHTVQGTIHRSNPHFLVIKPETKPEIRGNAGGDVSYIPYDAIQMITVKAVKSPRSCRHSTNRVPGCFISFCPKT